MQQPKPIQGQHKHVIKSIAIPSKATCLKASRSLGLLDELCVVGLQGPFLDPQLTYSCLTVLMEAFKILPWLPTAKPGLYAKMLELFRIIAADSYTGNPMLDLLRQTDFYIPQLDPILCRALPSEVSLLQQERLKS